MNKEIREIDPRFGYIIKRTRIQKGYSLKELKELTGISESYLNRLELNERKNPTYPIMQRIAVALGLNIAELLELANMNETSDVDEITDVIVKSDFRINHTFATTQIKDLIVKLFEKIISADWSEEKRFIAGGEMLTYIGELEVLLGKA